MAEKSITVQLTEEEGALVWDLIAERRKKVLGLDETYKRPLCKSIHAKLNAAAKAAGIAPMR